MPTEITGGRGIGKDDGAAVHRDLKRQYPNIANILPSPRHPESDYIGFTHREAAYRLGKGSIASIILKEAVLVARMSVVAPGTVPVRNAGRSRDNPDRAVNRALDPLVLRQS